MYLCQYFSDVLPQMYVFPYYYSALMALRTVLHMDTVLVAVALMIMTSLGPSPGLGRHKPDPPDFNNQLDSCQPDPIQQLTRTSCIGTHLATTSCPTSES